MSSQRVVVTYAAAQSFISSDSWKQAHDALLAQLPLRNIHWKSASRTSIRTIQELDVALTPLDTIRDEVTSQVPVTLLEKPLLNIYIVTCEELEAYRTTVKKQIKDWQTTVTQRKNQEWLILHLVRPDVRASGGGIFKMKGSVYDRLKADFNMDKRDRCVQLAWASGTENPTAWADLINKIKDGVLSAFDTVVTQREEEVKRSEGQRQMPGWNFCTFFILKESLAHSFEGVNLFEDALVQYDELEASFFQVLREKNHLSWFGILIAPSPTDDSQPLLSVAKKPYRDLILANTISVFDFRVYLLARQCAVLAKMGKVVEAGRKASAFLGTFGRRLREVEDTLPRYFVESWKYSSALSAVEQLDLWSKGYSFDGAPLARFNAVKGELLEIARTQLDVLGIKVGHLPSAPPFSMGFPSLPASPSSPKDKSAKISKQELLTALDDREAFYDLYVSVTNRAIDMYAKAGRRKFALKLHGSLAALDVHRNRLATALQTYTSLPAHYAPHTWTALESTMLARALATHAQLAKPRDPEWIHIVLAFLKTFGDLERQRDSESDVHEEQGGGGGGEYARSLVMSLVEAAKALESDVMTSDHPALSITVAGQARIANTEDGSYVDVEINNRLPCALHADEVTVIIAGRDTEHLRYTGSAKSLTPGKSSCALFCATSSSGTYVLDSSEIRLSKLLLQRNHRRPSTSGKSGASKQVNQVQRPHQHLVRIPRDLRALDVRLRQPRRIELGAEQNLLVSLTTGRNHVLKTSIKLYGTGGVRFAYSSAKLLEGEEAHGSLTTQPDSIIVSDVESDKQVDVVVPYSHHSAFSAMKVSIDVEYTTKSQPDTVRSLRLNRSVVVSLPVAVNVQDFFRGTRMFSKFTVSTTTHQHVRILNAQLQLDSDLQGVKIRSCLTGKQSVVTVTPAQPADFLFQLDSANGPVKDSLKLLIKYRMLREEVETLILRSVDHVVPGATENLALRESLSAVLIHALEKDASWVELYGITGELEVPGETAFDGPTETMEEVKKLLRSHRHAKALSEDWREMAIPVDVPQMNIVAAAHLRLLPLFTSKNAVDTAPSLYAGQPMPAELTIQTSFHWASDDVDKKRSYRMRFDIEEMVRDWLVSGQKRGEFSATDGGTYTIPVTLIALQHGQLFLPKVAVSPLPTSDKMTMGSMALPSTETYQVHGAEKVLIFPRGGRSTFILGMGGETNH